MRPLHGDDRWTSRQRPRATRPRGQDAHLTTSSVPNSHMSFCITDEASLDSHRDRSAFSTHPKDSKHAVESLRSHQDHRRDDETSRSPSSSASLFTQSPLSLPSQAPPSFMSRPITPIMLGPSCVGSAGSSSSSRRNSFTSSLSDHPVGYDQGSPSEPGSASNMLNSGSAPQLVMPSIMMPSRRPFTETGKNLGRLKILLAGDSGVGKTSLLKAIVQTCHHIVHVDPISPLDESSKTSQLDTVTSSRRKSLSTTNISEVHASTKPYPEWRQDLDIPGVFHKRKRLGDNVLERNICFVDTPGFGRGSSAMDTIVSCVDYVESHLSKVSSDDLSDSDLINMLGGSGGCQVDVVLYLILHSLKPTDLEYIRRLIPLTNVIPILSRAELLSEEQTTTYKQEIARQLESAGLQPFTFTSTAAEQERQPSLPSSPYTASSVTVSDHDIMDASLLMSPDYVEPLVPTDLAFLVERIFSLDGASWLRHSAANKYLQWRDITPRRPRALYKPLAPAVPEAHYLSALCPLSSPLARRPSPQQGIGTAQLRMADWVTELQGGFMSERLRYEALTRRERAVWLTAKLHDCLYDGTLVVANEPKEGSSRGPRSTRGGRYAAPRTRQHQDPLGLLQVVADLKVRGWVAVEILSSLSMVGLVVWISRHGWLTQVMEFVDNWIRL